MVFPAEIHREEIVSRTRNGESCEQIAEALRTQYGIDITYKTISRKRCEWGLRSRAKRPPNKNPSIRKNAAGKKPTEKVTKVSRQAEMKDEINVRTQRGETAQQIADELQAAGHVLAKGVSTILRLQTYWGLIPYDHERAAKGSQAYREERKVKAKERRVEAKKQRTADAIAQKTADGRLNGQASTTIHYPSNCAFGPGRRPTTTLDDNNPFGGDSIPIDPATTGDQDDDDYTPLPPMDDEYHASQYSPTQHAPIASAPTSQDYSRELMSANLMVDLAISMLGAAKDVKDVLLAAQFQRPATSSTTGLPPSDHEVSIARRKLKEATRCAWDLAKDGVLDDF